MKVPSLDGHSALAPTLKRASVRVSWCVELRVVAGIAEAHSLVGLIFQLSGNGWLVCWLK